MISGIEPFTEKTFLPDEVVLLAIAALEHEFERNAPNTFSGMKPENEKKSVKLTLVDENLYMGSKYIVWRTYTDEGKLTWLSTGTDNLALARKFKAKKEHENWARQHGFMPPIATPRQMAVKAKKTEDPAGSQEPHQTVNSLADLYVEAGFPIVKKRSIKRKAERTIFNEKHCLPPIREFFGPRDPRTLTLADCDRYQAWRNSGGYVAKFKVRGKDVTRKTRGGDRAVDLELVVLRNILELAVRRGLLEANPLADRGQYTDESTVRHCREVAPTPSELVLIVDWLEDNGYQDDADLAEYLAYTGKRIGEALKASWLDVDWHEEVIHVVRSKKGVFPFVLLLPELARLLRRMKRRARGKLFFCSPEDPSRPRDDSTFRRRLKGACKALGIRHVTPHGLRSYFVTQARQSGLTDAEIAQLIGDKTGPSLIAEVYGDVRPDHLLAVARKIRLTAKTRRLHRTSRNKNKNKNP